MTLSSLQLLLESLRRYSNTRPTCSYAVPDLWQKSTTGRSSVDPSDYYGNIVESLLALPEHSGNNQAGPATLDWSASAVVYNLFVRLAAAFDHDGDGLIGTEPLACGFRETGTFLKSIAMLPYLQRMGINTVYLLPVSTIGEVNRKGSLGSPYAIKNPCRLDPMLGEPALDITVETQLEAFVEAAHRMDMKVVFEFVFRTGSIDSDWVEAHPDWFYWLRNDPQPYGPPEFDPSRLAEIYEKVDKHDLRDLPEPDENYRNRFVPPPETISCDSQGCNGLLDNGLSCRVASAFSDWPPDDRQPPWTDVAYLRMHRDPRFNYIAYNTIRMYDEALDLPGKENQDLWNEIQGIIPWYRDRFGIDGAMMDMGHALPSRLKASIVEKAREGRPDFAFWDETFDPSSHLRDEGFNAVFGSLPFVVGDIQYIRGLLNFMNRNGVAIPFFATGESHNTPRLCHNLAGRDAGRNRVRFFFTLGAVLPAIPFIHSGMELLEWHPVNLGLNFSDEDRQRFPSETLPLFSPGAYDWEQANGLDPLCTYIRHILDIRSRYLDLILCGDKGSLQQPYVSEPALLAIMRKSGDTTLIFLGNSNFEESRSGSMEFEQEQITLLELTEGRTLEVRDHRLQITLDPGCCCLFELPGTQAEQ